MTKTKPTSDHWSDYWSQGSLTSLPQDFAANYDGEVALFWGEIFRAQALPACMLDLCTGNGAIALLAASHAAAQPDGNSLNIVAVDAADIDAARLASQQPAQAGLLARIELIGQCQVEELPFPDQQFDLVSSQYGIEYCDWSAAAKQVARVLKPGGRLVLVSHSHQSDIMTTMQREQQEYQQLQEIGLFRSIQRFLDGLDKQKQLRAAFRSMGSRLAAMPQARSSALFQSVLGLLKGALSMPEAQLEAGRPHLQSYIQQLRYAQDRVKDMMRVNQAIATDPQWHEVFSEEGLVLQKSGTITYRGRHHAGDFLVYTKP